MFRQPAVCISNSAVSLAELSHNSVCCRCLCSPRRSSGWTALSGADCTRWNPSGSQRTGYGSKILPDWFPGRITWSGPGPPCASCCQVSIHTNYLLYFGFTFPPEWTLMPPWGGGGNGKYLFSVEGRLTGAVETSQVVKRGRFCKSPRYHHQHDMGTVTLSLLFLLLFGCVITSWHTVK